MSEAATDAPVRGAGLGWLPESVWRPLLRRCHDALAAGRLDEGRAACLTLLATYRLPAEVRAAVYVNQAAYAQPLTDLAPGARWRSLDWDGPPDGRLRREPSPVLAGGSLFAFGRAVHPARPSERADVLLTLDDDLAVRETVRLGDETGLASRFDDVRPFTIGNELHAAVLIFAPDSNEWTRAGLVRIVDGAIEISASSPRGPGTSGKGWPRSIPKMLLASWPGGNRPRCSALTPRTARSCRSHCALRLMLPSASGRAHQGCRFPAAI